MNIQNAHQVVGSAGNIIGQLRDVIHGYNLGNSEAVWVWMQCVQLVRGRLMQLGQKRGFGLVAHYVKERGVVMNLLGGFCSKDFIHDKRICSVVLGGRTSSTWRGTSVMLTRT